MAHIRVPNKLLIPLIEDFLKKQEDGGVETYWGSQRIKRSTPLQNLAFQLGISDRRLWQIRNRSEENCDFSTADKVLVGLGKQDLWYSDPNFAEIYETV